MHGSIAVSLTSNAMNALSQVRNMAFRFRFSLSEFALTQTCFDKYRVNHYVLLFE